jgi:hypothetical protein
MLKDIHDKYYRKNHWHHHQELHLLRFLFGVDHGTHGSAERAIEHVTKQEKNAEVEEQLHVKNALDQVRAGHQCAGRKNPGC